MSFYRILCFMVCVLQVFRRTITSKIFDGSDATTYHYQVSLQTMDDSHFCDGSIIDAAWVLTAARCIHSETTIDFKILAGSIDRTNGVWKDVSLAKRHPGYDPDYNSIYMNCYENNIGLVRIIGTFTFTDTIQPIKLANDSPGPGSDATLTGWGYSSVLLLSL